MCTLLTSLPCLLHRVSKKGWTMDEMGFLLVAITQNVELCALAIMHGLLGMPSILHTNILVQPPTKTPILNHHFSVLSHQNVLFSSVGDCGFEMFIATELYITFG